MLVFFSFISISLSDNDDQLNCVCVRWAYACTSTSLNLPIQKSRIEQRWNRHWRFIFIVSFFFLRCCLLYIFIQSIRSKYQSGRKKRQKENIHTKFIQPKSTLLLTHSYRVLDNYTPTILTYLRRERKKKKTESTKKTCRTSHVFDWSMMASSEYKNKICI